jgi:molybdate transport system substrate-binding protein
MVAPLHCISSMATRQVLADLAGAFERSAAGCAVRVESVGGVDAARRVQAGEAFDVVALAGDALAKLDAAGHLQPGSRVDLMRSDVAVAVRAGTRAPDIASEAALRQAVLSARTIGYSTGPSGVALLALFERWGVAEALAGRTVQAPPGVPVGSLVAQGAVELGFQQLSELAGMAGIDVVGPLPEPVQIVTTFAAAVGAHASQPDAARAWLAFMASPAGDPIIRRHAMTPARRGATAPKDPDA